ncbi:MAG: hydrogenase [Peptococcaceae bacterium]|nr:hydrogenase [Peptococcaceae bacterium]
MARKKENVRRVSRRSFLKFLGGASLAGASLNLVGWGKPLTADKAAGGNGWLPTQYNIPGSWPTLVRGRVPIEVTNPSIVRDSQKCILCGQCIEVCKNVQSVFGHYSLPLIEGIVCVNCGQCIHLCPSGAISEVDDTERVLKALADPDVHVVVQTAPATRVALGEEFGLPVGTNVQGKQVAALRKLGFDAIFDTNFTADLTIMEEGTELVKRVKGELKKPLPQLTSCCPGWVKFVEYFYPDLLENLSSAKSPQQMEGALIKTYYAKANKIDPEKILSVSIMPCIAKKFECKRPEMVSASKEEKDSNITPDVDIVLTTRELARMIKKAGIDFNALPDGQYDRLMGDSTGAAVIFGATGGVMEAAIRSAYYLITGQQPPLTLWDLQPVRGLLGVKEAAVNIPGIGDLKVAVVSGLANARKIMDQVRAKKSPWAFIEVMACPSGCQYGGGQPRASAPPSDDIRAKRSAALYQSDSNNQLRNSHDNPEIAQIYKDFLGKPMSELAETLLHTEYKSRAKQFIGEKEKSS